jgi:hypothetical protein
MQSPKKEYRSRIRRDRTDVLNEIRLRQASRLSGQAQADNFYNLTY